MLKKIAITGPAEVPAEVPAGINTPEIVTFFKLQAPRSRASEG